MDHHTLALASRDETEVEGELAVLFLCSFFREKACGRVSIQAMRKSWLARKSVPRVTTRIPVRLVSGSFLSIAGVAHAGVGSSDKPM